MQGTLKDKITNILAILTGIAGLVQALVIVWSQWIVTVPAKPTLTDWLTLVILVVSAVVAWATGKTGDLKAKKE